MSLKPLSDGATRRASAPTTRFARRGGLTPRLRRLDAPTALPTPPDEATTTPDRPRVGRVTISRHTAIEGDVAERLWEVYSANFSPLDTRAVLQHLYGRDEILRELANERIVKVVGWSDGEPVGFGMVTTDLENVPQISPNFLRARYPEHAARDGIFYAILVLVAPSHRRRTLFARLCLEMAQITGEWGGVLIYDLCNFNRETQRADSMAEHMAAQFPDASVGLLDQQTWYAFELPHPLAQRRP